jgi:hypothetical protein
MLGLSGRSKVGWVFGRFDVHIEREAWEQGAVAEHFHLHTTLLMEKGGRVYHGANRDRCTIWIHLGRELKKDMRRLVSALQTGVNAATQ